MTGSRWTDERIDYATRRWKEGGSGAEIAAELNETGTGLTFTKNSVICKMFRLGLSFQGGSRDGRSSADRVTRVRTEKTGVARVRSAAKPAKSQDRAPKEVRQAQSRVTRLINDTTIVAPQMPETTFYGSDAVQSLVDNACKWPVGDPLNPDFRFCCSPQESGFVYCAFHARMAYVPSSRKSSVENMPLRRYA